MFAEEIRIVRGEKPGNVSVILVGVHGNETPGLAAIKEMDLSAIVAGEVRIILGNPEAVKKNVRFIEQNLNRMFRAEADCTEEERASYEYRRSREIMPLLEGADALLDVHASNTKESEPFCICEPQGFALAHVLPAVRMVSGFDALEPGGTDAYMNARGGKGICFEAGYIHDTESNVRARIAIESFLQARGHVDTGVVSHHMSHVWTHMEMVYHTQVNFVPVKVFADFAEVAAGEVIGMDGEEQICAPSEGVVLFVRARHKKGEEAFLFGRNRHSA